MHVHVLYHALAGRVSLDRFAKCTPLAALRHSFVRRSRVVVVSVLLGATAGVIGGYSAANSLTDDKDDKPVVASAVPAPSRSASVASAGSTDLPGIIATTRPSVVALTVTVESTDPGGAPIVERLSGTGIVWRAEGLIVTNAHVVAGATAIEVTLADAKVASGTIVGSDASTDLAIIHIDRTDLKPARLGDSTMLRVGDVVVAFGNAFGLAGGPTATIGIVSALERTVRTGPTVVLWHLIQTDAAINGGDSGGPLINSRGEVVGIATATTGQEIGFVIPIATAVPILTRLLGGSAAA